jgi:CRP/FNR family cyclic AMP-dependent transcriptional regulator
MIDVALLRNLSLFNEVAEDLLQRVAYEAHIRSFTAGHYVLFQGDTGDALYLILHGTVKVFLNLADGSEVFLALLGTGDVFGEMSLIDASGRSANVLTRENTQLLIMDQKPQLWKEYASAACEEIAHDQCPHSRSLHTRYLRHGGLSTA